MKYPIKKPKKKFDAVKMMRDIRAITPKLVTDAADLATKHALRGYDSVQLAAALAANRDIMAGGHNVLTFVSADGDLNLAAVAEKLTVENPNDHCRKSE